MLNEDPSPAKLVGANRETRDIVVSFVGVGRTTLQKAEEIVTVAEQESELYQKKYGLIK